MASLKILHLIDTLEGGGAERVLINVLAGLTEAGCQSAVAVLHNRTSLLTEVEKHATKTLVASEQDYRFLRPWCQGQARAQQHLIDFAKHFHPDVIHANLGASYLAAYYLNRKIGVPYVLSVHGEGRWWPDLKCGSSGGFQALPKLITQFLITRSFRRAKSVIAVSKGVAQRIEKLLPGLKNVQVLENCVDPAFFEMPPSSLPKVYDVIMCGRLVQDKDPLFALRVIRSVLDRGRNVRAVWVGDGPLRDIFEQEVLRMRLGGNVHLTGWLSQAETIRLLDQSRLLFVSSQSEGFSLVATEAMSRGLRVLLGDLPSLVATFQGCQGVVFYQASDEDSAALKLISLLDDQEIRPCPSQLIERFRRRPYIEKLVNIYINAIKHH